MSEVKVIEYRSWGGGIRIVFDVPEKVGKGGGASGKDYPDDVTEKWPGMEHVKVLSAGAGSAHSGDSWGSAMRRSSDRVAIRERAV